MIDDYFNGFDFSNFWDDCEYALAQYVDLSPSDLLVASIEKELGYKLPKAYVALMKSHNGGTPHNTCIATRERTSWAQDHVAIAGIMGIGRSKTYSLCGELGSAFMIEEWGYPKLGVYFADCPSAGHHMVAFDYRRCGPSGEPSVVHVDQEDDFKVTDLAPNFVSFIRALEARD